METKQDGIRKTFSCFFFLCFLFIIPFVPFLNAQESPPPATESGDAAIARRYLVWAEGEIARGRWAEALAGLERGADYGDVSSDLSYLLALARSTCLRPRKSVLEAARRSLETDRWAGYTRGQARILEAAALTEMRQFEGALAVLELCSQEEYETLYWKLRALKGLQADGEFLRVMALTLDRFPRHSGPVRILFEYAAVGQPRQSTEAVLELVALALRRLPLLLKDDPELAVLAAPFVRDTGEARSLTAAYRAEHFPSARSLPPALKLGLLDDSLAVEELFAPIPKDETVLDRALVLSVWRSLRGDEGRALLKRNLLSFSGVIVEDTDGDGIIESSTWYRNGLIVRYSYDEDQDRVPDWNISFAAGVPREAEITVPGGGALLFWEQYPAVLFTELGGVRYIPKPMDYFFTPLRFVPLVQGGPLYPERADRISALTERSLQAFAAVTERPSGEFSGAVDRTEFQNGLPVRSRIYVGGRMAAETEFRLGRPVTQRIDLDGDGRMETLRHFSRNEVRVELAESDWDGDGIYEYAETYGSDGTTRKSWDLNKDGKRETEQ
jgi:hypothetical protein